MTADNLVRVEFMGGPLDGHVDTVESSCGAIEFVGVTMSAHAPSAKIADEVPSEVSPNVAIYRREIGSERDRYVFCKTTTFQEFAAEFGFEK